MNEDMETIAQLQYENFKLMDELKHVKEHTFSLEETLNIQSSELTKEKQRVKSLEQQSDHFCQKAKEKEVLIEILEHDKKKLIKLNTELSSEKLSIQEKLKKENLKTKELETLKIQGEGLKNAYDKLKKENQKLISELSLKSEECFLSATTVKDLMLQIKELEGEKAELVAMRDMLLLEQKEERMKSSENLECFMRKSPEWSKFQINQCTQSEQNFSSSGEKINLNLREEILEVELREMQIRIGQLESLLCRKEEEELARNQTIMELKQKLSNAGLLNYNSKIDLRLDSSAFNDIYSHLLKLLNWPEGHSGECKALTEVASLSVVVKDGVQATQPSSVRIIETISIASQTDPVKNLSPFLPFKSFEKSQSDELSSDSDDEGEESLSSVENRVRKGLHLFTDIKNCNLDMDLYRSCRKLSVLPEEDTDESFNRKGSFKKSSNPKFYSFNSKTQSANDITNITSKKSSLKGSSSYSNITSGNYKNKENNSFEFIQKNYNSCKNNLKDTDKENLIKFSDEMKCNDGDKFVMMSPRDVLRQPLSFDSYLDPANKQSSFLARQISDPIQTMGFTPFIAHRGSYIRKPKSTCRPLTLPCDKGEKKQEERICKVRFDLKGTSFKKEESATERKVSASPDLNNTKQTRIVSRFRIEMVDEAEFRKSLEENSRNVTPNRKRPPLVHSAAYKKSALRDSTNFCDKSEPALNEFPKQSNFISESPDSPVCDTAAEESSSESYDVDSLGSIYIDDLYPLKRRRQSDISCNSFEDSQDNSEGNDIILKSIKLHTNSDCLIMKEIKKEYSDSSGSNADSEIPYIDAEDLPVIKPSPDIIKLDPIPETLLLEIQHSNTATLSPGSLSEGSDTYFTPSDITPVSENSELSPLGHPKTTGLSKSPTVLKNLANFELLAALSESKKLIQNEIIKEEKSEKDDADKPAGDAEDRLQETLRDSLNRTSSDISETSESDTLTYGTVKSHMTASSDCDSDTYVTVWSDRSLGLERKFSDLSENSSSPYNTPPDTSSASFCTPPDTYSPILNSLKKLSAASTDKSARNPDSTYLGKNVNLYTSGSSILLQRPCRLESDNNGIYNRSYNERPNPAEQNTMTNFTAVFDSPILEFYETNDAAENLEAFLQTEEGLKLESEPQIEKEPEGSCDDRLFEVEEFARAFSRQNNHESPVLLEKRPKKHPPLSRLNSTEDSLFLEPHDSCLNLSEEISSPSTTPDTSNKTVIFKKVPLTVSNTIDLEDDFSISETEFQINFGGSQSEILEMKKEPLVRYTKDSQCLSEPCTPSISSADFLSFTVPRKHRASFTEESLLLGKLKVHPPEIIVSNLSSESENSEFDVPDYAETDFASNLSDRSEVHLSDVNSPSEYSVSSNSDKSNGASSGVTRDSSPDRTLPIDSFGQDQQPMESSAEPFVRHDDFLDSEKANPDLLMSQRSAPLEFSLDLGEVSSASDRDSDNSRDINLNSKKFSDCNLIGTSNRNINDECGINDVPPKKENSVTKSNAEFDETKKMETIVQDEEPGLNLGSNLNQEDFVHSLEARKNQIPVANSSTPKPESAESQALCTLFSVSSDSSTEPENGRQTYLVAKTALNGNNSLSNEEIGKKFQDLSFAFKTDSMTIPKRLHLMKRRRDQAESNIENELSVIKAKLKTLQYFCINSEYVNLMADLRKQLDFVLNAVLQLSSSAESYGYTQHEEKLLEFVTIMLQHVENIEGSNSDSTKAVEKLKAESKRYQTGMVLDSEEDEDRMLRRQSVVSITRDINSRRRASIATLPRVGCSTSEKGINGKGFQWTPNRPTGGIVKKLSFSQASSKSNGNNSPGVEDPWRDSNGSRHRKESRNNESTMRNIEEFPERRPSAIEPELLQELPIVDDCNTDAGDSSLHLKQLFESIEEIRRNSNSQEHITAIYCLRRIIEWSNLLINSTRFRWPESGLHFVPFYITWYVVFVLALVFMGGLLTGINGCYTYSCLMYSALWFAVPAFFNFLGRSYRFLLPLLLTVLLALIFAFLWLTEVLLPQLSNEEIDSLFKTLGLEIRYLYGPPPI